MYNEFANGWLIETKRGNTYYSAEALLFLCFLEDEEVDKWIAMTDFPEFMDFKNCIETESLCFLPSVVIAWSGIPPTLQRDNEINKLYPVCGSQYPDSLGTDIYVFLDDEDREKYKEYISPLVKNQVSIGYLSSGDNYPDPDNHPKVKWTKKMSFLQIADLVEKYL